MAADLEFPFVVCRVALVPETTIAFPVLAANVFRGAMGFHLAGDVFRPHAETGPSGYRQRPKPFVFRTMHLNGRSFGAGEPFEVQVNVFSSSAVAPIREALEQAARAGVSGSRLRIEEWHEDPRMIRLDALRELPHRVRVVFETFTEIKHGKSATSMRQSSDVALTTLAAALRDRIGALRTFYGSGPLDIDHAAFVRRAAGVRLVDSKLEWHRAQRTSSRTGQTHPLGGFTGWADYEGELGEFMPYLEAGHYTGVGRQTVWGKGQIKALVQE